MESTRWNADDKCTCMMESPRWNLYDRIYTIRNSHEGIRTMESARWNIQKVTMRKRESVHRIYDLERTQDVIVFLVRIAYLLVCSYCGKYVQVISHNRHCDLAIGFYSSQRQSYEKSTKHCAETPVSSTTYSLVYKVLSAHPSLIRTVLAG